MEDVGTAIVTMNGFVSLDNEIWLSAHAVKNVYVRETDGEVWASISDGERITHGRWPRDTCHDAIAKAITEEIWTERNRT